MTADHIEMLIYNYWYSAQTKKAKNKIPARQDINLGSLEGVRDYSFIVRKTSDTTFVIRVGARALSHMLYMDTRGMQLVSLFHPNARARALDMIDKTFSFPAYQRIGVALSAEPNAPLAGMLLLLPLTGMDGFVDHALGGYIPHIDQKTPQTCRFYTQSEETRSLVKQSTNFPLPKPKLYKVAETPSSFLANTDKKTHLRLISSKNNLHHS